MSLLQRLDRLPLSRPHHLLLLIGGLGYTFDGMDGAIVAFLLPSVREEWGLTSGQSGIIGSATPLGYLIGATVAGLLADRIGRRRVMMWSLAFYAAFTLVAAVSPTFEFFVGARVVAGIGTGAESAIIAPFLAEFVPARRRGWFIGALAGFFSFGYVGAALIGRFVVPNLDDGWRWAQVLTALPVLLLLWWRRSLPESPRFLLLKGRTAEAEVVVADFERRVEAATGQPLPPVPASTGEAPAPVVERASPTLFSALRFMWSPAMARRTAVVWTVWFVITFAYYGFFSWIPTLLIDRGLTVSKSFTFSIVIYLAQIPGYFSAAWLNERLDRRRTIALYLVGSAVSAFLLSQMDTSFGIVAAGALLSFFLNGVYSGLYAYTPEVFPTWIRASGTGLSSAFGRIGSISAPAIIGFTSSSLGFGGVFTMITVVLAVGVFAVLVFGLSTTGRSLEELTETDDVHRAQQAAAHAGDPAPRAAGGNR
ncbi:MFS transporter [Modestobacter sp. L9-4]|uniref:MFS transporter n=1 Tax=Modestobacter sp. L9-4 TaxID=2851567 RepID=UPI001C7602EE|nr:MFS transporter [Modestobacter sp. L9-4]QXG77522.1 MFS transporter [Modestobacter sp. L9-4]